MEANFEEERRFYDFDFSRIDDREPSEHVNELALCEASRLVLRSGELYRFYVVPSCATCREEASNGEEETDEDRVLREDREDMELFLKYPDNYRYGE